MNAKIKIAAGAFAGLVAGTMLVGTAFAAPWVTAGPASGGYGMMRSFDTSGTVDRPSVAAMQDFMNRYRTPSGAIDVNRMHSDVISGKVTPPHMDGTTRSTGRSGSPSTNAGPGRGYGMMRGSVSSSGHGLMGGPY